MAIKLFIIAAIVFAAVDLVWLGLVANKFYRSQLGDLLRPKPQPFASLLFYVVYLIGLVIFVLLPAYDRQDIVYSLTRGALYGFFTYCTYDLTNLATLRKWPAGLAAIDIAWGTVLGASVSAIVLIIA